MKKIMPYCVLLIHASIIYRIIDLVPSGKFFSITCFYNS